MKKRFLIAAIISFCIAALAAYALGSSETTNLGLTKPTKGDRNWGATVNNNMDLIDAAYGNYVSTADDLPQVYVYSDTFNSTAGTTITLPNEVDAVTEYSVSITPTTRAGAIGDIYVTKTTTNFVVKCSEANTTDTFAAVVYYTGDASQYGGSIYRRWYVSPDSSITDHGNASTTGSLAWVAAQISTSPAIIEMPGNKNYQLKQNLTLADNISYQPQPGAIIDTDFSIRDSNYEWYQNGATSEYYLQASGGGNPNINMPSTVIENDARMTDGAAGSLAAGEWDWNDVNGLGYTTVYVRLSDSTDPDGKAADYVKAGYTFTQNCQINTVATQIYQGQGNFVFGEGSIGKLCPRLWGATGDGTTEDTTAIQAALDASYTSKIPVFFPKGTYYTDTLTYYGQSMYGVPGSGNPLYSSGLSVIKGKDSNDVFQFPDISSATQAYIRGTVIKDLTIIVDDTTDAAGSFSRDGGAVGNAAFALQCADGTAAGHTYGNAPLTHGKFENVSIESLSGTSQNNSCGIFQQALIYDFVFDHVHIQRLEFGFWGTKPTANDNLIEYAPDCLHFISMHINGCINPFRVYNSTYSTIDGMQIYGAVAGYKGTHIEQYTSLIRAYTANWSISNLYEELSASTTGEVSKYEGWNHNITASGLKLNHGDSYITWEADQSYVGTCRINGGTGATATLKIAAGANNNRFENISTYSPAGISNWVDDDGSGNLVTVSRYDLTTLISSNPVTENIGRHQPAFTRTGDFARSVPSTPYFSHEDLFIWPSDMDINGASETVTKDASIIETGEYITFPSPGGANFYNTHSAPMALGYMVPECKVRIYVKAKMATSATTQFWDLRVNNISKGSATHSITTSWAVYSWDADLTGLTKGHSVRVLCNNPAANQDVHVAWVAIVPFDEETITEKIEFYNGPVILTGSGTPEAVVTAPPGSLYTSTAGGSSTTLYVKESGTGNTGWVAK